MFRHHRRRKRSQRESLYREESQDRRAVLSDPVRTARRSPRPQVLSTSQQKGSAAAEPLCCIKNFYRNRCAASIARIAFAASLLTAGFCFAPSILFTCVARLKLSFAIVYCLALFCFRACVIKCSTQGATSDLSRSNISSVAQVPSPVVAAF